MAENNSLNQQLVDAQTQLSQATEDHRTATSNTTKYSNQYNAYKSRRDGGECASKYSLASKRSSCQANLNNLTAEALASYNYWYPKRDAAQTRINQAKKLIETLEEQIDSKIKNSSTLAKQGLTSEAVETSAIITANAKATAIEEQGKASSEAIKTKSLVEAKSSEEMSETKNKLTLIIGVVVVIVIIAIGVIALKKFKNKK